MIFSVIKTLSISAFIAVGAIGLLRLQLHPLVLDEPGALGRSMTRDAASDQYFRALLGQQGIAAPAIIEPTARLHRALASISEPGPLLFVAPRETAEYDVMYQLVRTLSLPRPVISAYCNSPEKAGTSRERIAAVVLYLIEPPGELATAQSVAPKLSIVPGVEAGSWTTFCSR